MNQATVWVIWLLVASSCQTLPVKKPKINLSSTGSPTRCQSLASPVTTTPCCLPLRQQMPRFATAFCCATQEDQDPSTCHVSSFAKVSSMPSRSDKIPPVPEKASGQTVFHLCHHHKQLDWRMINASDSGAHFKKGSPSNMVARQNRIVGINCNVTRSMMRNIRRFLP